MFLSLGTLRIWRESAKRSGLKYLQERSDVCTFQQEIFHQVLSHVLLGDQILDQVEIKFQLLPNVFFWISVVYVISFTDKINPLEKREVTCLFVCGQNHSIMQEIK